MRKMLFFVILLLSSSIILASEPNFEIRIGTNKPIWQDGTLNTEINFSEDRNFRFQLGIEQELYEFPMFDTGGVLKVIAGVSGHAWESPEVCGTLFFLNPKLGIEITDYEDRYLRVMGMQPFIISHDINVRIGFSVEVGIRKKNTCYALYYEDQLLRSVGIRLTFLIP